MTSAWSKVVAQFGGPPHVDVWSPTEYRVWVKYGWHVHNGAATSDPVGHGRSLESACEALLRQCVAPGARLVSGECDWRCQRDYSSSSESKVAHRGLMTVLEEAAARVDSWPAWKRGLPPCTNEACDREFEHKGRHRRARKGYNE